MKPRTRCSALIASIVLASAHASAAPVIKKGPWLQDLDATSVVVRAELDAAAPARLEVTPAARSVANPASLKTASAAPASFHSLRVSGLSPLTTYHYKLDAGGATEEGTFTTAPGETSTAPISFLLYGDNRSDDVSHAAVLRAMAPAGGDFLLNTGDVVEDGNEAEQWQRFFEIEKGLLKDRCLFSAVGNHELIDQAATSFLRYLGPEPPADAPPSERTDRRRLYRSVRWGTARFFFLNGMDTFTSGAEKEWLDAELTRADNEPGIVWRIVVVHHGAWAAGPHGPNPRLMAAHAPDTWKAHRIDMVFSGHDHIYERGEADGIKYVVSGGGGAPLYRVRGPNTNTRMVESTYHFIEAKLDGSKMSLAAKRIDGSLIERCSFTKNAAWDCAAPADDGGALTHVMPVKATSNVGTEKSSASPRCGCRLPGAPVRAPSTIALLTLALLPLRRLLRRRARA